MKKTILLADHDESVRKNLARLLELEQYAVLTANCGSQAVSLLDQSPDLALFDLDLSDDGDWPGLDTICDSSPSVPIILITARSHQYKRAMQLGADALMEKPFDLPLLLKTIRNLLREPRAERLRRVIDPGFKTLLLNPGPQPEISISVDWAAAPSSDSAEKLSR